MSFHLKKRTEGCLSKISNKILSKLQYLRNSVPTYHYQYAQMLLRLGIRAVLLHRLPDVTYANTASLKRKALHLCMIWKKTINICTAKFREYRGQISVAIDIQPKQIISSGRFSKVSTVKTTANFVYIYTYIQTYKQHLNADTFSRMPMGLDDDVDAKFEKFVNSISLIDIPMSYDSKEREVVGHHKQLKPTIPLNRKSQQKRHNYPRSEILAMIVLLKWILVQNPGDPQARTEATEVVKGGEN
ncbi:hypothetical protein RF11_10543 [Thelohanellus kitauei]|uniref:Uncharacterized protein n=1 Tax=Thelohanellus kitauei TaxID=669202 RepID=A0A0C2N8V7_THEKT|nr:hypothetical protein RF11_10543 [Thelohanellus kitauei]